MKKQIFLTGGSGFVGQHMIREFTRAGYQVLALTRSDRAAQKAESLGTQAIMDDLCKLSHNSREALKTCPYVVHSAAYMDFNYEKDKFYQINVEGSKGLVQLAKECGVERFIYISAAPVVPGSPIQNLSEAEAQKGLPKALYPKTKALAEKAILAANTPDFTTISLRPPAIWGPDNHHMDEMLERVRKKQWAWIGGSRQILSTIHVKNLAAATRAAFEKGKGGQAYFVTDGDRRSMRETFSEIIKAYGLDPGQREIPLAVASILAQASESIWKLLGFKSRPPIPPLAIRLMAREFSVSDAKARQELGYQNVISFQEGIREISLQQQS
ncbi:MAG: NAD-dependent epimerase/dehydratase family protein [Bacteroidota bacterium]